MLEIKSTGTYIENDIFVDGVKIGTVELLVPDVLFPIRFKKENREKKKRSKDADTAGCG